MKFRTLLLALLLCCVCAVAHAQQRICTPRGCFTLQKTASVEYNTIFDADVCGPVAEACEPVAQACEPADCVSCQQARRPMFGRLAWRPMLRFWR